MRQIRTGMSSKSPVILSKRHSSQRFSFTHNNSIFQKREFLCELLIVAEIIFYVDALKPDHSVISFAQSAARSNSPSLSGPFVALTKNASGDKMRVPPFDVRLLAIFSAA